MSKHTPGPWEKVDGTDGITRGIRGWHGPESVNVINWNGISRATSVTGQANARLLLAAPDLLEACETFAEWLGREESGFARAGNKRDTPEGERAWRDWYNENLRLCALAQEQARAAIAKATGEKP